MQKFLTALIAVASVVLALSLSCNVAQAKNSEKIVTAGHVSSLYQCDLGDKLTIYKNAADNNYVILRWRGKLYRLERQQTTTGAGRYESKKDGLVLLNIPTKSMLFDSKKGRQLANECKNPEQRRKLASKK